MKLLCLAENTSQDPAIGAEHGLSLYIETRQHKLLFDMGQSDLFARNAARLGVDLAQVDLALVSHGHYDHGGGLATFLQCNQKAPVYLSPYAFEPHFNAQGKDIGLDPALKDHPRLIYVRDTLPLAPGLTLYPCQDRAPIVPCDSAGLTTVENGVPVADDFRHELYLLIREAEKTVLISGCSHRGILNIVTWFDPDVLVGGFHFSKLPLDDTLAAYARQLSSLRTVYHTCHCTGTAQYAFMKQQLPQLSYLSAGQTLLL